MTGFTVLLVDDEESFVRSLAKRLRIRGLDADSVTSGEDALAFLDRSSVDVVVLDVRMPGMDGVETLREIKKRPRPPEVIILTGYANPETAVQVMELGAFDYLMKPIAIDDLVYRLQDAYKKRMLHDQQGQRASER